MFVAFGGTKSAGKSEVIYFLKWWSNSTTLYLRNCCYYSPHGLTGSWSLPPSPTSLLLTFPSIP